MPAKQSGKIKTLTQVFALGGFVDLRGRRRGLLSRGGRREELRLVRQTGFLACQACSESLGRVCALGVFFGFTKHIPFTHGFQLKAVVANANSIRGNSPVRIAGVEVGQVVGGCVSQVGEQTFNIRDFGVEPPKILMLMIFRLRRVKSESARERRPRAVHIWFWRAIHRV